MLGSASAKTEQTMSNDLPMGSSSPVLVNFCSLSLPLCRILCHCRVRCVEHGAKCLVHAFSLIVGLHLTLQNLPFMKHGATLDETRITSAYRVTIAKAVNRW